MPESGFRSRWTARGKPRSATFVALSVGVTLGAIAAITLPASAGPADRTPTAAVAAAIPRYDHVVVVVHENANHEEIIGNTQAPFINQLAAGGASFTDFHGETHPSQPNYLAMFSGGTQGVTGDECPPSGSPYGADNLARQLIDVGATWGSYNEDWQPGNPSACTSGSYARKHNPWLSFGNVPAETTYTTAQFPTDFTRLPTVSYVVPNLCNDMHDRLFNSSCGIRTGDTWTNNKLGAYAAWAKTHNSLLVVTWDEDNFRAENRIATVVYGANVKPGQYAGRKDHYSLLRTFEDMYGTRRSGQAANATPITEIWQDTGPTPVSVTNPGTRTGTVGQAASLQLQVSGGTAPYTCAFQGLPAGLTNPAGGCAVSGTPTAPGSAQVTVTATDGLGAASSPASFTWTIAPTGTGTPPTIASPGNRSTMAGTSVDLTLATTGSPAPTCTATGLPAGLTIGAGCRITGTPTTPATSQVTVTATNASGSASAAFQWTVTAPPTGGVTVADPGAQSSKFNQQVDLTLGVSGGTAPYTCAAKNLPTGLWLNPFTCAITGKAWGVGTFATEVTATDGAGRKGAVTFPWSVTWF
ncbi:putative Ig domain-containing protein [Streptomyces sp. SID3343]|uniref:putative Ig domain-containing protein n=1 Tax=Streptomyces sp. SID3343 TaxID=2690260 RepID=UPI001368ED9E|nr:putative Ig domain-containing protein [Streptomyces sp. SID3343]MYV96771.1 hypothetical protein [Streptomyces sp. SID3343]